MCTGHVWKMKQAEYSHDYINETISYYTYDNEVERIQWPGIPGEASCRTNVVINDKEEYTEWVYHYETNTGSSIITINAYDTRGGMVWQ
jgi:hypothetical protein